MKKFISLSLTLLTMSALTASAENAPRTADIKTPDGTTLKATYFAAARPGPGVLLFHQSNRTRESWDDVATKLAGIGINALAVDTDPKKSPKQRWPGELDAAFAFLVSQP